ncbi:anthranilate dioxygenase reductase [Asticcacaulis biprosthecium C19]|uniref:Anthranilate dioxygenase reductase n=1 Tax=Asticcacaulis biprosthecium C19 TaxID=715226 RepID=F4QPQ9_9CAUL|nr:FAD-dependent oxidoreductase [Asticcacaulis biprosthecium]EGF90196.1 anthranilate dioxygenase reductase [Asticcacaulis biprosthecium C19]
MAGGVVIVGAGHGGGAAAGFLRQYSYEGDITLIGAEPYLPYQRPPLSKAWLKGDARLDDVYLRNENFYPDQGIATRLNTRANAISNGSVALSDGENLPFDHLILATGSKARPFDIPGTQTVPHHLLRSLDDAERLKGALQPGHRIGLIGAGYVGLEVAASARHLGCEVTLFEREPRILARVASRALSDFFTDMHLGRGVRLVTEAFVTELSLGAGDEKIVHLADGRTYAFDLLLVGIGALPADDLAQAAGIACANGIVVDTEARTSAPDVFAIGDVTSRTLPFYDGRFRLESVPNALEQAKQAAAAITGYKPPVVETPWFWSDQYEFKLQIAGLLRPETHAVVRGDPATGSFSVFHLDGGSRVLTAECVNRPADFMSAKLLIAKGITVDATVIADAEASLKPYLAK